MRLCYLAICASILLIAQKHYHKDRIWFPMWILFQTFRHKDAHLSGPLCFLKLGSLWASTGLYSVTKQTRIVAGGCAGLNSYTHQTQGSDLGGQGGGGADLSSCAPHVHCRAREHFMRVKFSLFHTDNESNSFFPQPKPMPSRCKQAFP